MSANLFIDKYHRSIKNVVILVQENRSFNHMVGWMKSLDPDGVTKAESNPISTADPNSGIIHFTDDIGFVDPDPGHSFEAVYEQVFDRPWTADSTSSSEPLRSTMGGFAQQAEEKEKGLSETVMKGLRPEAVPVFKELVAEFGFVTGGSRRYRERHSRIGCTFIQRRRMGQAAMIWSCWLRGILKRPYLNPSRRVDSLLVSTINTLPLRSSIGNSNTKTISNPHHFPCHFIKLVKNLVPTHTISHVISPNLVQMNTASPNLVLHGSFTILFFLVLPFNF